MLKSQLLPLAENDWCACFIYFVGDKRVYSFNYLHQNIFILIFFFKYLMQMERFAEFNRKYPTAGWLFCDMSRFQNATQGIVFI